MRSHVTSTSAGWGQVFWDGTESDTVYLNLFLGESSNRGTIHNGVRAGGALSGANYWYAKPQPPTSNAPAPLLPLHRPLHHSCTIHRSAVCSTASLSLSLTHTHTHTQPRARVDQREVPPPNLIEAVGIFCLVVQVQLQPLRRGRCDCRRRQLPARAAGRLSRPARSLGAYAQQLLHPPLPARCRNPAMATNEDARPAAATAVFCASACQGA